MTINVGMKSVVMPLDLKEIINQISQDSKDKIVIAAVCNIYMMAIRLYGNEFMKNISRRIK